MLAASSSCQPRILLLASSNRANLAELRRASARLPLRIITAEESGLELPEVAEDGETFADNAALKALAAAAAAQQAGVDLWALADDSGLEVDALGGAPGVRSARFAGAAGDRERRDRANMELLLERLREVPDEGRTARFVCVLAVADATGVLATVEGTVAGRILRAPRGSGGFGYDPVFLHPPSGITFAQMEPAAKQAVSHRGQALRRLRAALARLTRTAVALSLVLGLAAGGASSLAGDDPDGPVVSDRPSFGDGPGLVPVGRVQVEGGATFSWGGPAESWSLGELLVRTGVSPRTEIQVGLNSYVDPAGAGGSGVQDAALGFKLRLLSGDGERKPDLALLGITSLPTGSDAQGADGLIPEARLAASWALGERLGLGANLNYAYVLDGAERFHRLAGGVSLGASLTPRLSAYGELFSFVPATASDPNDHFVNAGVLLALTDNVQLDLRAGHRLGGDDPDWFAGFGATWRPRR